MSLGRTSPPLSVDKSLALLVQVLEGDFASISALASAAGLPLSTAHRLLTGLQHAGFIVAVSRGRYISGQHCGGRSEEHTSELQSLMRSSYAVFCLKKQNIKQQKR